MEPLVKCQNLKKTFETEGGTVLAVDDVSFSIQKGETIGLVGESGCGKSTIGRTMLNLISPDSGSLRFEGQDIFQLKPDVLNTLRKKMGIIFQNPYSSLNPRMKVFDIIAEPIKTHYRVNRKDLRSKIIGLLEKVGLKEEHLYRFPHQFSGGQRQRIAIARSLALDPNFLVLDEPTSALDVSVQAQVLNLLRRLQRRSQLTYLFITHDLDVVKLIADKILVMYLGKIVESGPVADVFGNPFHPYTNALLSSIPKMDPLHRGTRVLLEGDVPSPINPPSGCRFHTRCPIAEEICKHQVPEFRSVGLRQASCHLIKE